MVKLLLNSLVSFLFINNISCFAFSTMSNNDINNDNVTGIVKKSISKGNYTYIELKDGRWVATNTMKLRIGQKIKINNFNIMHDFFSKSLNKTFKNILFASSVNPVDRSSVKTKAILNNNNYKTKLSEHHSNPHENYLQSHGSYKSIKKITVKKGSIKKLKGGLNIFEINQKKVSLAKTGKNIKFSAIVIRVIPNINGKFLAYVSDGSIKLKKNLVITSSQIVKVGQEVSIEGQLTINYDFGYGFFYPLIVKNASLL